MNAVYSYSKVVLFQLLVIQSNITSNNYGGRELSIRLNPIRIILLFWEILERLIISCPHRIPLRVSPQLNRFNLNLYEILVCNDVTGVWRSKMASRRPWPHLLLVSARGRRCLTSACMRQIQCWGARECYDLFQVPSVDYNTDGTRESASDECSGFGKYETEQNLKASRSAINNLSSMCVWNYSPWVYSCCVHHHVAYHLGTEFYLEVALQEVVYFIQA